MPLKLIPPRPGKSPNWSIRGTYLRVSINETTGTADKRTAAKALARVKEEIERGGLARKGEKTFADVALAYAEAGGERRFLGKLLDYFDARPVKAIDQAALDAAAVTLYPKASPATRNRQVYSPMIAILAQAGVTTRFRRPKGALGVARTAYLWPEQFAALQAAARAEDEELAALFTLICYTGLRLSEALRVQCADVRLTESLLFCGKTKNGEPRTAHLPPVAVAALANHPEGLDREGRVFRFVKNKWLYARAERAYKAAKLDPQGAPFHILRHTYGAWMTRAGADLVGTGAWRSKGAASVYEHVVPSEEARKADLLPGASSVENTWNAPHEMKKGA